MATMVIRTRLNVTLNVGLRCFFFFASYEDNDVISLSVNVIRTLRALIPLTKILIWLFL